MSDEFGHQYQEHGYLVIKGFLSAEEAQVLARGLREYRQAEIRSHGSYHRDSQVPKAFSAHGQFDSILRRFQGEIQRKMGIKRLQALHSYARIYEPGAELPKHRDRIPLEHSATICLSRDEVVWKLGLIDLKGNQVVVLQEVGDALLYQGKLEHWRIGPYQGVEQAQVFLHYYDRDSVSPGMRRARTQLKIQKLRELLKKILGPFWAPAASGLRVISKMKRD